MSLSQEQLEVLDSCPGLKALKPWIVAIDESVNPQSNNNGVGDEDETGDEEEDEENYNVELTVTDGENPIEGASVEYGE